MNTLEGQVRAVLADPAVTLVDVDVGGRSFAAMLVPAPGATPVAIGARVRLQFKETEVALARGLSGLISLRNRHPGRVTEVECGRVLTRIVLDFDGQVIESVITTSSAQRLALAPGVELEWLVKANEMGLEPLP